MSSGWELVLLIAGPGFSPLSWGAMIQSHAALRMSQGNWGELITREIWSTEHRPWLRAHPTQKLLYVTRPFSELWLPPPAWPITDALPLSPEA